MVDDTAHLCEACGREWDEVGHECKVSATISRKQCYECLSGRNGEILHECSNRVGLPKGFSLVAFANATFCTGPGSLG